MDLPCLFTDRLILRAPAAEDAAPLIKILCQDFVRRYNCLGTPLTEEAMAKMLEANAATGSQFVLEHRSSGRVIGSVGLQEDSLRYRVSAVGIDYYLSEEFAGKGYMTEALTELIGWLFSTRRPELISARVFTENTASLRLLAKLGFQREGVLRRAIRNFEDKVFDDVIFSLLKEDYESRTLPSR